MLLLSAQVVTWFESERMDYHLCGGLHTIQHQSALSVELCFRLFREHLLARFVVETRDRCISGFGILYFICRLLNKLPAVVQGADIGPYRNR